MALPFPQQVAGGWLLPQWGSNIPWISDMQQSIGGQDAAANPGAYWGPSKPVPQGRSAVADQAQRQLNDASVQLARDDAKADIPNRGTTQIQPQHVAGASVNPNGPVTVGVNGAVTVNPYTGQPASTMSPGQSAWMAGGGSAATMHRAQVASGRRPAIDARTNYAAGNFGSPASAAIQAGWGWGGDSGMGTAGSQIWDQMTQHFNNRIGGAKAKLQGALNNTTPMSGEPSGPNTWDTSIGGDGGVSSEVA